MKPLSFLPAYVEFMKHGLKVDPSLRQRILWKRLFRDFLAPAMIAHIKDAMQRDSILEKIGQNAENKM
jgi:hypothetical protein